MNIIKRIASFFGFSEAKQLKSNPAEAHRRVRSIKQAKRALNRAQGIPAAKRHRFRYYIYNPAWFGIQQNQMAKGIVRPAS